MSERWELARVLALVDDDRELVERLFELELFPRRPEGLLPEEAELVRIAHVLVRELDVNWPGVEIILRLRGELVATRQQVADVLELVRRT